MTKSNDHFFSKLSKMKGLPKVSMELVWPLKPMRTLVITYK